MDQANEKEPQCAMLNEVMAEMSEHRDLETSCQEPRLRRNSCLNLHEHQSAALRKDGTNPSIICVSV